MKKIFTLFAALAMVMSMSAKPYLRGSFNGWGTGNEFQNGECTINLAANTKYEFKVDNNGDWSTSYGGAAITSTKCTDVSCSGSSNATIQTTLKGSYTFKWNASTKKISVVYPTEEVIKPKKDITVKAKMPASWTKTIDAWVWTDEDPNGKAVTPEKDGDWYVITQNTAASYIIFRNGATWNGDANQTVDMCFEDNACIQLAQSGSSKATYTNIDCVSEFTLTATANPAEGGSVTGAGVYEEGTTVNLTATPNEGYEFVSWTNGGAEVSTNATYSFVITANLALVANFKAVEATVYTISIEAVNGTVTGAGVYEEDATVTLTATPADGYNFKNWTVSGAEVSAENPYIFTATADVTVTANFEEIPVEYETVYFVNAQDWEKVCIYTWTPEIGTWPGKEMTKEAEQIGGKDVYSYTIEKGTTFVGLNFNNGNNGKQTGDLTWTAGKYYVIDNWYTKEEAEEKLATPVQTYDYYVVGTFNSWANPDPKHGMTLVGDVYKATVTLNVGANMLKVTNGTWENAKGFDAMGAEYEEVSNDTKDGNILITLTEGKDVVVVYNATTGKVTFEGLTEKLPAVITYVLMGVNNDWTTGISLVRNEENTEYEEYMLLGQEILAGDAVKVVTLTDGVATAYCGNVDVQSIELLGVTFDENGNVVLAPGKYDFYYKVADNGIYIAGEAYPVEPELPAASVRAWAYDLALAVEGEQYTFSYKATTAALATLIFTDGEGVELATVELGLVEAGANSVVLAKSELPAGKKVNWAVKLEAGAIAAFTEVTDASKGIYNFYLPQGVAVDNNPESATFGNIYVAQPTDGQTDGSSDRADNQKQGIFVYDQTLAELNTTNVGIVPSNVTLASTTSRQVMKRIAINPVTNEVAFAHNAAPVAVWAVPAENVGGEAKNLIEGLGFEAVNAICFDEEGALYVLVSTGYPNPGSLYKVVDGQVTTLFADYGKFGNADVALASDGRGGVWIAQNRGQLDTFNQLTHVNAAGEIDFELNSTTPHGFENMSTARGTLAYNYNEDILAIGIGASGTIGASLYQVTYDETTGVPALTFIAATPSMGKNVDGLAFDYAGDLYGLSANKERFYKYAVPTESNVCTTPAASKYAFQNIEYDTMAITMTNLEVDEMMGYLVLTASDEMETGLNVMLALNEDGSVSEMSYAAISSGWMETELPIVGGNITKTYSEELATDVYSGLVVVENMGGYLGLQLTMYAAPAAPAIDVVATDANIYYDEYGSLCLSANWNGETLNISGIEVSEEPSFMMIEEIFGEGEEDWYIWMSYDATTTVDGNVLTIAGEFTNSWTGDTYNVTITGTMPQGTATDVDNLNSSVAPVKILKNGQVIIIKNGVQYSVQGQVIK